MVPRTASVALSHAVMPYLEAMVRRGLEGALEAEPGLGGAVNIDRGKVALPTLQGAAVVAAAG